MLVNPGVLRLFETEEYVCSAGCAIPLQWISVAAGLLAKILHVACPAGLPTLLISDLVGLPMFNLCRLLAVRPNQCYNPVPRASVFMDLLSIITVPYDPFRYIP